MKQDNDVLVLLPMQRKMPFNFTFALYVLFMQAYWAKSQDNHKIIGAIW